MRDLKEKKGFTLIELLAVIVILAIVTVIGATTVLPYIRNAKESAFADEVHYVIEAASNAINLKNLGSIELESAHSQFVYDSTNKQYCITLEKLVNLGLWTKDVSALDSSNGYRGKVLITESGEGFTYSATMTSNDYYVSNFGSTSNANDVQPGIGSNINYGCGTE